MAVVTPAERTAAASVPAVARSLAAAASPALAGRPSILLADEPTGNLDSRNGEAVMNLLRELHREGSTICMVTHDPRYADYAQRQIRLFDGRVMDEDTLIDLSSRRAAKV